MYFNIALAWAKAEHVMDHPADIFDKEAEVYQVWELRLLEKLDKNGGVVNTPNETQIRRGFSVKGGADTGVSFRAGSQPTNLSDPIIVFEVPDLAEEETVRFQLDFFWYESDGSTPIIKSLYADDALKHLLSVWEQSGANEEKAKAEMGAWLKENAAGIVLNAIKMAGLPNLPFLSVNPEALTQFGIIIADLIKNNKDDFLWQTKFIISFRKKTDYMNAMVSLVFANSDLNFPFLEIRTINTPLEFKLKQSDNATEKKGNSFETCYKFRLMDFSDA